MRIEDVLDQLDKDYPDKATVMTNLTNAERDIYMAKLELINHIRLMVTPEPKKGRRNASR